jgi:hypothetical protein
MRTRRVGIALLAGLAATLPAAPAEAATTCYDRRARTLAVDASTHVFRIGARTFACDRRTSRVFTLRLVDGRPINRYQTAGRRVLVIGDAGAALYDVRTRRRVAAFSDPGASIGSIALAGDEAAIATLSAVVRLRPGQDPQVIPADVPRDLAYAARRLWWSDPSGTPYFAVLDASPAPVTAPAPASGAAAAASGCTPVTTRRTLIGSATVNVFFSGARIRGCRRGRRARLLYDDPEDSRTAVDVQQLAGEYLLTRLDTETEQNSELSVDVVEVRTGRTSNVHDATGPAAAAGNQDETAGDYRLLYNGAILRSLRPNAGEDRTRTSLTLLKGLSSVPTRILTTTTFTDEAVAGRVVFWADDTGPHLLDTT